MDMNETRSCGSERKSHERNADWISFICVSTDISLLVHVAFTNHTLKFPAALNINPPLGQLLRRRCWHHKLIAKSHEFHFCIPQIIQLSHANWGTPGSSQYHIQTDEGPERYFRYQTDNGQFRKERRLKDGTVIGTNAWIDGSGYLQYNDYIADHQGYRILKSKTVFVGKDSSIEVSLIDWFLLCNYTFLNSNRTPWKRQSQHLQAPVCWWSTVQRHRQQLTFHQSLTSRQSLISHQLSAQHQCLLHRPSPTLVPVIITRNLPMSLSDITRSPTKIICRHRRTTWTSQLWHSHRMISMHQLMCFCHLTKMHREHQNIYCHQLWFHRRHHHRELTNRICHRSLIIHRQPANPTWLMNLIYLPSHIILRPLPIHWKATASFHSQAHQHQSQSENSKTAFCHPTNTALSQSDPERESPIDQRISMHHRHSDL